MAVLGRAVLLSAVIVSLFGCASMPSLPTFGNGATLNRVATIEEAGSLHIAVLSVEPWDLAKATLSPNFALPASNALTAVVPTTANASSALLEAMTTQIALQAALGQTKLPSTSSSSPQAPSAANSAPAIPAPLAAPPAVTDPFLQYDAANSLYQKVQLINRQVQAAAKRYNYRPYIVGLQLRMEPYARNQPYDAYADVSFFTLTHNDDDEEYFEKLTDINKNIDDAPIVIPLLATENLVNTQTTASANRSNQFSAALTALIQKATGTLNFQSIIDAINQINAPSLTNVEAVARHTDNTIRVRMGATISPDLPANRRAYVMQSRSYNVTVLLLAPARWDNADPERIIHLITQLELRDSSTGQPVNSLSSKEIDKRRVAVFDANSNWKEVVSKRSQSDDQPLGAWARTRFADVTQHQCPNFKYSGQLPDEHSNEFAIKSAVAAYLSDRVIDNRQRCFVYAMDEFGLNLSLHQFLWQAFARLGSTYGYSDATLALPPQPDPVPPPSQRVILIDNKSTATGQLVGGQNLSAANLVVHVTGKAPGALPIYATTVTSTDDKTLLVSFPSLTGVCGASGAASAGATIDAATRAAAISELNMRAATAKRQIENYLGESSPVFYSHEEIGTDKADFGTLALQLLPLLSPVTDPATGHVPSNAAELTVKLLTLVRAATPQHAHEARDREGDLATALAKYVVAATVPAVQAVTADTSCGTLVVEQHNDPWIAPEYERPFRTTYEVQTVPAPSGSPGAGDGYTVTFPATKLITSGTDQPIVRMVVAVQKSEITKIDFSTAGGEIIGCANAGAAVAAASCAVSTTSAWTLRFSPSGGVTLTLPPTNIPAGQPLGNATNAFDLMLRNLVPGQTLSVTARATVPSGTVPSVTASIEAVPPADRRVTAGP